MSDSPPLTTAEQHLTADAEGAEEECNQELGGGEMEEQDEQATEDQETWYQNVEMKLGAIPDSSDRYTPTCDAIHQIQDLFQEVVDKQVETSQHQSDLSFSFDSLLQPLSVKQETLFSALVHFHQIKLSSFQQVVEEGEMKIEEDLQIEELEEYRTKLKECEKDLQELIEAPQPLQLTTAIEPEQQQEQLEQDQGLTPPPSPLVSPTSPTAAVYSQLSSLLNKSQVLLLRCQDLVEKFDTKMQRLESELNTKNERFLRELDEVEEWLNTAYDLLRQEPSRVIEGAYSLEGDDGGRERLESDASLQFSDPGDLLDSGSFGSAVDPQDGVDVTLGDEEYQEEVLKRVISPEREDAPELVRPDSRESSVDPPSPPPAPPPAASDNDSQQQQQQQQQDVVSVSISIGSLGDDADTVIESGSGLSGSTLRGDPIGAVQQEISSEGVNIQTRTSTSDERVNKQSEEGVNFTVGGEERVNDELEEDGSQEDEELSSEGDKFGLHWIRELQLLPMEHDPAIDQDQQEGETPQQRPSLSTENDICHLLDQLDHVQSDLKIQSQKLKSTTANISFVINTVSVEKGRELERRLESVKQRWENLSNRLKLRRAQLAFEKAQRDILDSVLEAVQELDDQPQSTLLPDELEQKQTLLMDFLISVDQFDSQKTEQLANLDESLNDLEGVWPEEEGLQEWKDTVEQLRAAYEAIAVKVKEQVSYLESCLSQWSNFSRQCDKFEEWLTQSEEMINRDSYGSTLQECEVYHSALKKLQAGLEEKELVFSEIVKLGNTMLENMEEQSEAEEFMDDKLSTLEQRWSDLVSQETGSLCVRESGVKTVLTKWKGYTGQHAGTQTFITQMIKMVGPEPLESSNGDQTLLSTYRTYADQLKRLEVQYNRLMKVGDELASNEMVGGRAAIGQEMNSLKMKWGPLKDNVTDSLSLLIREYNDWILTKLKQMETLVREADGLVQKEVEFVEGFPLENLLDQDACELLKEYDILVASQERINQMDVDCNHIEEQILERQIQHETSTEGGVVSSESLEYSSTTEEKSRLVEQRERIIISSDCLQPVLNVFGLQLQLMRNIQEDTKVVSMAIDFVGEQEELEELLEDVQIKLSDDHFERLKSDAYDLGTVLEESQEQLESIDTYNIPSYDKLLTLNRSLTAEVEVLSDSANAAFVRLQLFIAWWAEYRSNYGDITSWLEEAESHLNDIIMRCESSRPPLVAPTELLLEAQELQTEVEDKSVVLNAMASTVKNILEEMESKGVPPGEIADQMADIQLKWESLKMKLEAKKEEFSVTADKFNSFLDLFGTFVNWLSEFYGMLYDEVCVQIPTRASDETIAHHRAKLEEFHKETLSHEPQYQSILKESATWANHVLPEDSLADLPSPSEPSPPPFSDDDTEFPPASQLSYVYRRVNWATEKWSRLQHLLQERDNQLEMCSGSLQEFSEALQNLLNWLNEKLRHKSLVEAPPASLDQLRTCKQEIQVTSEELLKRQRVRESLETSAMTLKTQVAGPNASRLDEKLSQVAELWERLTTEIESRKKVLDPLISRVETLWSRFTDFNNWLAEQEKVLEECGPIGAHLQRLTEQTEILELQDDTLLEKKRVTEDLNKDVVIIISESHEGSGSDIQNKYGDLESRFMELSQQSVERRELCEEALSAMQDFQKKVDKFTSWLEERERNLADKRAEKKPIGTIQTELEEFYDFMSDIEKHTDDYLDLRPEATQLSNTYKPSDVLDEMMSSLHNRWCTYVEDLSNRSEELLGLADLWRRYETEVKELLDWVSTEAEGFSKEVTTEGDEGIEDHIESCKMFADTLETKRHAILEVEDLANILRAEDGAKKNGTSDVESRWNDLNQHWNSLCKLLAETLLRLEATYAEVRHVIQIRTEEFDWLIECECRGNTYRPTRGNLDAIQEEITEHEQLLEEVTNHKEEAEFVRKTVPFLVEHSRKQVREEMKQTADDFIRRYETLRGSQDSYITNLQDSIPHWKEFNEEVCELQQWIEQVNRDLESDKLQPGNASMTETSLVNARRIVEQISLQTDSVQAAANTSETLSKLVISSDMEYVSGIVEEVRIGTEHISEAIDERTVELEERLKSWQVFPVEEARVVQAFLDEVESEVAMETTEEEEMTSDQLLEKLKRLETLQEIQSTNEDKVTSIDQSADSEDVKKALEKNPDISKERTNLLQGWSTMSNSLKEKIAVMKRKAEMVQQIEQSLYECENALKVYRTHLDVPFPPSVVLAGINKELNDELTTLHNRCQSSLSNQQNLLDRYSTDPDVSVPVRLTERAQCCNEDFHTLSSRAEQRTNQITDVTKSWLKFEQGMKRFTSWLRTSTSELSGLKTVENFVLDFSSLEDRLQTLTDEVSEKEGDFDALRSTSLQHCSGEGQEVQQVKQMFTKVEQSWCSLKDGVKALTATIKPWKELTDQFEQLNNWFDLLEHRVRQDETVIEERHDVDGNVSDLIVAFKGHLDKLSQQEPELQELQDRANDLLTEEACAKFRSSVGELRNQCETLDRKWEELREQADRTLSQLEMKSEKWNTEALRNKTLVSELQLELAASQETSRQREHVIIDLQAELDQRPYREGMAPPPPPKQNKLIEFVLAMAMMIIFLLVMVVVAMAIPNEFYQYSFLSPLISYRRGEIAF